MNQKDLKDRIRMLEILLKGERLLKASRLAKVSINTLTKYLLDIGNACLQYQKESFKKLDLDDGEINKVWMLSYGKSRGAKENSYDYSADVWAWSIKDTSSKLIFSWQLANNNSVLENNFYKNTRELCIDPLRLDCFEGITESFSKKLENVSMALALHFMHYNFCQINNEIKTTPAMQAGLTDKVWYAKDIVLLLS